MTKSHPDERRRRLEAARLCVLLGPSDGDVEALAGAAVAGGADMVQLRWKGGATGEVAALAERLVAGVGDRALVIVNDDVEAAVAAGAHGVHLGQDDLPIEEARRRLGPGMLLGLSTHDAAAAHGARARGADSIGFGAMFATATKDRPDVIGPAALDGVRDLDLPCFAIGGIDASNVARLVERGCARVAVSRAVVGAADPEAAARALLAALGPRGGC